MNRILLAGLGLGTLLLASCGDDHRHSGGGSVQPGDVHGLYVANGSDDNSITRVDLDTGVARQIQLGKEPTRIARNGTRVYVSLRNERAVAVIDESAETLAPIGRIETGAEPYGVVATDSRLYVAASLNGTVDEYDAKSYEHLRSWHIAGEPRWLTMHPSGKSLYVGSAYGGVATRIDLGSGTAHKINLPAIQGFNNRDGTQFELAQRITGDLAVSPDGTTVWVPMLYVDNSTPIPNVDDIEEGDPCNQNDPARTGSGAAAEPDRAPPPPGGMGGDCGGGYDQQKFNPAVDKIPVDQNGEVVDNGTAEAILVVSSAQSVDVNGNFTFEQFSSYPAALAVDPASEMVFGTMFGSSIGFAFLAEGQNGFGPTTGEAGAPRMGGDVAIPPGGGQVFGSFSFRQIVPIHTGTGPSGVAIIGAKVYFHDMFDREVVDVQLDEVRDLVQGVNGVAEKTAGAFNTDGTVRILTAGNAKIVHTNALDSELDAGRRMFFAANNPQMARVGAGVSCGTCHFEGRTDGLTWRFDRGLRQTPNLAVNLADTLPVGWAGNVPTVTDEGFNTSQKLMGGQGLPVNEAHKIEKFLYSVREIDSPNKNSTNDSVIRGAAIFANSGCNGCHNGASYTDGKVYTMLGLQVVNTPALRGISGSAPYFHDGSAVSLESVIDRAMLGEMGNAFQINADEKADLIAYLRSL